MSTRTSRCLRSLKFLLWCAVSRQGYGSLGASEVTSALECVLAYVKSVDGIRTAMPYRSGKIICKEHGQALLSVVREQWNKTCSRLNTFLDVRRAYC